jgi:hypothetical protein
MGFFHFLIHSIVARLRPLHANTRCYSTYVRGDVTPCLLAFAFLPCYDGRWGMRKGLFLVAVLSLALTCVLALGQDTAA